MMFGLFPRILFWLAIILVSVAAILPQPLGLPVQLDENLLRVAAFVILSLLAVWAYPFTRLVLILLGLVLFAGVIEVMKTIPQQSRDTDVFLGWGLEALAVAISVVVVAVLRKFLPQRLALPPPGPERNAWKRYALRPALVVGIFLAGTALADRTGQLEVSVAEMLPPAILDFAKPDKDTSYVQRFVLPEATPASDTAGSGSLSNAEGGVADPLEDGASGLTSGTEMPEGIADTAQPGLDRARSANAGEGALLAVDFDLAGRPGGRDAIEIRKPVSLAGASVGQIRLRIDENSQLYADASQIEALLPDAAKSLQGVRDGFVSFQELRNAGIPIRYDVAKDQIVLAGQ